MATTARLGRPQARAAVAVEAATLLLPHFVKKQVLVRAAVVVAVVGPAVLPDLRAHRDLRQIPARKIVSP